MNSSRMSRILIVLVLCICTHHVSAASTRSAKYSSAGRQITYEIFGIDSPGPLLVLLHGASGPDAPLYREQALYFADHGFTVLFPHYFDASGSTAPSDKNYSLWSEAVMNLIMEAQKNPQWANRKRGLMGLSLGASVALAAGSQKAPVEAVVDWYGSLPDSFFEQRKGMPPLLILHGQQDPIIPIVNAQQLARLCEMEQYSCESHFYPAEGHGFSAASLKDADERTLDFLARKLK